MSIYGPEIDAEITRQRKLVVDTMVALDYENDPLGALTWWNIPSNLIGNHAPIDLLGFPDVLESLTQHDVDNILESERLGMG